MTPENIHVTRLQEYGWAVKQRSGTSSRCFGTFRKRVYAEAYGRALAHRDRVELIVHRDDGEEAHYQAAALTYPSLLS
jgi:hypothetical protein